MTPLETYLRDLREIRSTGSGVKETSYYPALSNPLNGMGNRLKPRFCFVLEVAVNSTHLASPLEDGRIRPNKLNFPEHQRKAS